MEPEVKDAVQDYLLAINDFVVQVYKIATQNVEQMNNIARQSKNLEQHIVDLREYIKNYE